MTLAIDKSQVARQFSRAASRYQKVADVQNKMADRLLELIPLQARSAQNIIDLGCGTGYLTGMLVENYCDTNVSGLDIAEGMLAAADDHFRMSSLSLDAKPNLLCGDMESLPLASNSFDLVISNAALQWTDLGKSLAEISRVLVPDGVAVLSTFVEGTLAEWRSALAAASLNALHQLADVEHLMALAQRQGLQIIYSDCSAYQIDHLSARALLESTKRMGATNAYSQRRRGLMGRQHYLSLLSAIEAQFPGRDYRSTYQAGFLILSKPS